MSWIRFVVKLRQCSEKQPLLIITVYEFESGSLNNRHLSPGYSGSVRLVDRSLDASSDFAVYYDMCFVCLVATFSFHI